MLRISEGPPTDGHAVFKLEGRLIDAWVGEAERLWTAARGARPGARLTVDLRDVLSVDAGGRLLLSRMQRDGASFVVAGCAMRALVAELNDSLNGDAAPAVGDRGRSGAVGKDVSGEP